MARQVPRRRGRMLLSELDDRRRTEARLSGERRLLEMIARNHRCRAC